MSHKARLLPLIAGAILAAGLVLALSDRNYRVADDGNRPVSAVDFARATGISGPVFNDYDFGGYLIFSGIPTYIDGRAELYGQDFFSDYYAAAWQLPGGAPFRAPR